MTKSAMVAAALLLGCNTAPPELLPPPFGPGGPQPARLFFPTGLAQVPDGGLLVANGNFNRAFEAGTMVNLDRTYVASLLDNCVAASSDGGVSADAGVNPDGGCNPQIPPEKFLGSAMIGNYAGPIALNSAGTVAFTASRDNGRINAVRIDPDGHLGCAADAGNDATRDCRQGIIDLTAAGLEGPYSIVPGDTIPPGATAPQEVFFVSSIVPHIESITSGTIFASTSVAALSMPATAQDPSRLLFQMVAGAQFVGNYQVPYGVGSMVFDRSRRRLYLGGCYYRSSALGAGEPGTALCTVRNNFLRIIDVDAASVADPQVIDLRTDVLSTYTVQMLLDVADPLATPASPITTLWATMRSPDSLVVIDLPAQPSVAPRVREIIPLPSAPADMARIDRGAAAPLVAVVAEKIGAVAIVDTGTSQVVAQIDGLGNSPFNIQNVDCPSSLAGSACLAVSVFADCRIALIQVPKADPAASSLRALAGSCPK
jgi:hypothetical protein